MTTGTALTLEVLGRLRGPRLFGLGHGARLWILLAVLVVILLIALVQRRNNR
jgi:hypothetical protein